MLSAPHRVARLALATGAPVIAMGIGLDPTRIVFQDMLIDGVTEHMRWYVRGSYFVTAGRPLAVTGSLEDREGVRVAAAPNHESRRWPGAEKRRAPALRG